MVKATDEGAGRSEVERADELLHDEAFRALIVTAVDAHSEKIRHEVGDISFDGMSPDVREELKELQVLKLLLEEPKESAVYRIILTSSATYIKYAPKKDVHGERLKIFGPPRRDEHNPIWQLSVRVSQHERDPYRHSPEELTVDFPEAAVTIMPERVYLDSDEHIQFRPGTGVTMDFHRGGRAEFFGAKGTGNTLYTTRQPIDVLEEPEIAAIAERLPLH